MKFEKFKCISQRKEWKSLTSREPTTEICDIWEKYMLKPAEIKFLATLLEYDQVNITDKFNYYRTLTPGKQKANNLDMYILKYGEEYGRANHELKVENSKNTLKRFIERHGEIVGKEKYDNFRNVRRDHEQMMINKYGEVEGIKRHKHFCERNKGNHTLERKLEMYSEDEAHKKYNNFIDGARKRHTLEGCIELYGEIEGPIKYYDKRLAIEFGASAEGYKLRYGDDYKEIMRRDKDNTSLESFIIRYGEVDGVDKFNKFVDRVSYSNSLNGYIEKYGEIDGRSKYLERRTSSVCKFGVSPISQELFRSIKHGGREYYAELNHEYFLITKYGYFYIDYVNKDRMKAVEFNGDVFHANPEIFKKDDRPNPFDKSKTSEDIWKYEEIKMKAIREAGFEILVIWEKDYRQNKNLVVERINEFIYG